MFIAIQNTGAHNDHNGSDFHIIKQAEPKADQSRQAKSMQQSDSDAVYDDGDHGTLDAEGRIGCQINDEAHFDDSSDQSIQ